MFHRSNLAATKPGQRATNRLRLGVPASLQLTSETRPCLLDDVSATGARLRVDRVLGKGAIVVLNFHELHLYAVVVWCHDGECGVRFDQRLPVEDMEGMLWITQNRELYDRMCREAGAEEWTRGIWE